MMPLQLLDKQGLPRFGCWVLFGAICYFGILPVAVFLIGGLGKEVTPIQKAIYKNDLAKVQLLVAQGADVNGEDSMGENNIATALSFERFEIADYLYARGANVLDSNDEGRRSLSAILDSPRNEKIWEWLHKHNINLTAESMERERN